MENQPANTNQEELITDFSNFFKKGEKIPKKPKIGSKSGNATTKTPNWLLQIPAKHEITFKDLQERRYMDERRWESIVKTSSGSSFDKMMASIISVWNFLFSDSSKQNPEILTITKAQELLKEELQISKQQISQQNGSVKTIFWLQKLMLATGKKAKHDLLMSFNLELTEEQNDRNFENCLQQYLKGLQNQSTAFIYFTYDKQFLIGSGFQKTPLKPLLAYKKLDDISLQNQQLWIINASVVKFQQPLVIKRWRDIKINLKTGWPNFLDIKKAKQGVQKRSELTQQNINAKKGNGWFIMRIQKLD